MNNLQKLIEHAIKNKNEWGGTLFISINGNRGYYESVEDYLTGMKDMFSGDLENKKHLLKANHIVHIQYYPSTPVGFYSAADADIEIAAKEILDAVEREKSDV